MDNSNGQFDTTFIMLDQINTIERLETKLTFSAKDVDQLYNLPLI